MQPARRIHASTSSSTASTREMAAQWMSSDCRMILRQTSITRPLSSVKVSSLTWKNRRPRAPQHRQLPDEVVGRVRADPAAPERRRPAEGAVRNAAAGQRQMRQVEVPARHGQCVEVAHRFGRRGPEGRPSLRRGQSGRRSSSGAGVLLSSVATSPQRIFAFTRNDEIDLRKMLQEVLPEMGCPHAAENDVAPGSTAWRRVRSRSRPSGWRAGSKSRSPQAISHAARL